MGLRVYCVHIVLSFVDFSSDLEGIDISYERFDQIRAKLSDFTILARFIIEKLDGFGLQKYGGSKQVRLKQLGPDDSDAHAEVAQRKLEVKQLEGKPYTDFLVNEQVYLGAKVRVHIMETGVPGHEGTKGAMLLKGKKVPTLNEDVEDRCGYCKNLKKTVKTGQTRTRERKSTQKAGRKLSKVKSGQLKSTFGQLKSASLELKFGFKNLSTALAVLMDLLSFLSLSFSKCMRTRRSNYPNNSNVTIPRRQRRQVSNIVEPEIRTIVTPMAECTMEELLRAPTEGYGEAIVLPEINADHFEIKTNLLQLVQANPFYGRESENPHAHINSFKRITSTLRFRNVPNDVIKLMMFPYSLEGAAKTWFNQNQVQGNNFNRGNNFHGNQGFQAQNNHAPNFQNQGFQNQPFQVPNNQVQQEISNDFSSYKRHNDQMLRNMQNQINSLKGDLKNEIQNMIKSQQAVMMNQQTTFQNNLQNMICGLFQNQASTSGTLLSNTIPIPKGEMKAITTRSGVAYEGPSISTNPSPKKVVERETKETTDKEQSNFQGSTAQIPPLVIPIPIPEPDVPKTLPKPNIPYPSR
ncbi:hypothetical protein Tco_0708694, partial [Tanacetum coccineum]